MNNPQKSIIKSYLKEVSSDLTCPKGVKRVFLNELKNDISLFVYDKPDFRIDDLYGEFGVPAEIAAGFFDRDDYENLLKAAKRKAAIWKWIGIITLLLCIILAVCIITSDIGSTTVITDTVDI